MNLLGSTPTSSNISGPPYLPGANPFLAPLGNFGGSTLTMALRPGSPAINAAVGSTALADQRGFPIVGQPDIGAYEAGNALSTNYNAFIWETLPATATASQAATTFDFDGDGTSNETEWLAGTGVDNPTSVFRIASVQLSGGNLVIAFPTIAGKTYTLWRSDTLTDPWTNTGQPAITGNGAVRTFTVPAPVVGVPKRFHRVQVP